MWTIGDVKTILVQARHDAYNKINIWWLRNKNVKVQEFSSQNPRTLLLLEVCAMHQNSCSQMLTKSVRNNLEIYDRMQNLLDSYIQFVILFPYVFEFHFQEIILQLLEQTDDLWIDGDLSTSWELALWFTWRYPCIPLIHLALVGHWRVFCTSMSRFAF